MGSLIIYGKVLCSSRYSLACHVQKMNLKRIKTFIRIKMKFQRNFPKVESAQNSKKNHTKSNFFPKNFLNSDWPEFLISLIVIELV